MGSTPVLVLVRMWPRFVRVEAPKVILPPQAGEKLGDTNDKTPTAKHVSVPKGQGA